MKYESIGAAWAPGRRSRKRMRHGPRQKCRPALRDINHVLRRRREQARDYLPLAVVRHSSSSRFGRLGRVLLPFFGFGEKDTNKRHSEPFAFDVLQRSFKEYFVLTVL